MLPLLVALSVLPDNANEWVRFTLLTLVIGYPYAHPILVAWNSQNSNTVRTRTVSGVTPSLPKSTLLMYEIVLGFGSVVQYLRSGREHHFDPYL